MTRSAAVTTVEHTLHAALELSKKSWLLAIQFPDWDNPSLYPIRGGNAAGLMARALQKISESHFSANPAVSLMVLADD